MSYKAEYIWIDGTEPTRPAAVEDQDPRRRQGAADLGLRRFEHQPGARRATPTACCSRCSSCPDPIRGGDDVLVMCEVLLPDMTPHVDQHPRAARGRSPRSSPTRSRCSASSRSTRSSRTAARSASRRTASPHRRRFYYCGVGADEVFGRDVVEAHLEACLEAGLGISGINAEVMPGQWEFQVGPLSPLDVSRPAVGRPLAALPHRRGLRRRRRRSTRSRSRATGTAPVRTPTSRPTRCARATTPIIAACEALGTKAAGARRGLRRRHRAPPHRAATRPRRGTEFSYGVSDRGASVRIPWQVEIDKKGYIEDRRPNANMDPYVVTRLITETVCSALAWSDSTSTSSTRTRQGPGSRTGSPGPFAGPSSFTDDRSRERR